MLCRLGLIVSSSSVGLGGVGVRRSCAKIAIGAFFAASRCRNPRDQVGMSNRDVQ